VEWDTFWNTGLDEIDREHRDLLKVAEALFYAGREVAMAGIEDFRLKLAAHFAHEEAMMEATGFAGAELHRQAHASILKRLGEICQRFATGRVWSPGSVALLTDHILFEHVDQFDRDLAAHVLAMRRGA
jgi:hemerythrin